MSFQMTTGTTAFALRYGLNSIMLACDGRGSTVFYDPTLNYENVDVQTEDVVKYFLITDQLVALVSGDVNLGYLAIANFRNACQEDNLLCGSSRNLGVSFYGCLVQAWNIFGNNLQNDCTFILAGFTESDGESPFIMTVSRLNGPQYSDSYAFIGSGSSYALQEYSTTLPHNGLGDEEAVVVAKRTLTAAFLQDRSTGGTTYTIQLKKDSPSSIVRSHSFTNCIEVYHHVFHLVEGRSLLVFIPHGGTMLNLIERMDHFGIDLHTVNYLCDSLSPCDNSPGQLYLIFITEGISNFWNLQSGHHVIANGGLLFIKADGFVGHILYLTTQAVLNSFHR